MHLVLWIYIFAPSKNSKVIHNMCVVMCLLIVTMMSKATKKLRVQETACSLAIYLYRVEPFQLTSVRIPSTLLAASAPYIKQDSISVRFPSLSVSSDTLYR